MISDDKRPSLTMSNIKALIRSMKNYVNKKIVNLGADAVGTPVGTILPYGGSASPTGWLLCEGQEVLRSDYPELFSVIGTSFGVGDGATTFNLPDMRDRAVMGATTGHILGAVEDDSIRTHTHTMAHTHSFTPAGTVSAHNHGLNNHTHSFTPAGTVSAHNHALSNTESSSNANDHTIFKGQSATTSQMSDHESGTISFMSGYDSDGTATYFGTFNKNTINSNSCVSSSGSSYNGISKSSIERNQNTNAYLGNSLRINVAHTHSVTALGTVTGHTRSATPTFTGSAGTTGGSTADTANATPTFTGSAGTTGASSVASTRATGSTETKPKNVRVNYIIKAKLVA